MCIKDRGMSLGHEVQSLSAVDIAYLFNLMKISQKA